MNYIYGWLFQVEVVRGCIYDLSPRDRSQPPQNKMDIVFFHGLQVLSYKNAYKTTWISPTNSDLWPGMWLAQDFPEARVLSVSYNSVAIFSRVHLDYTATHLAHQLIVEAEVGKDGRTTILVGHSLGGLVIKKICEEARQRYNEEIYGTFLLRSLRGVFFYATPHGGSPLAAKFKSYLGWTQMLSSATTLLASDPESDVFTEQADIFNATCDSYNWETKVLAEGLPTPIPFTVNRNLIYL